MSKQSMLTTVDNPYNPFTHWDEWYTWDEAHGYHTCGLLARFTITSHELSSTDEELAIDLAIQEILDINPFGVHKRIYSDS